MINILKRQLVSLPMKPGIYQFFNAKNKLLYVGKAKSLRSRVQSYFRAGADLSPAKKIMVTQVHHLVTTEVTNETEALLLERTLIKHHQPPYNIDLRDDKSWLYITINYAEKYPTVSLVRRPKQKRGQKIYGPYIAASAIRSLFPLFKKLLGLKTCFNEPTKPCFQASLGRCLGHDLNSNSNILYLKNLKYFEQILRGDVKKVVDSLTIEMIASSKQKNYERAAKLRDQLRALARLKEKQTVVSAHNESFDVIGLARNKQSASVVRLPIRHGVLQDAERFLVDKTRGLSDSEVLTGFLEQMIVTVTDIAKIIYLPYRLLDQSMGGSTFKIPIKGDKKKLLSLATKTAATHLDQGVASWQRKEVRAKIGLKQLKESLNLIKEPHRIEGYDISNIQGKEAVGSMVVLTNGLPDPKQYRKFKIQSPATPNDFRMLAEVLLRRFSKNKDWPIPDLVMLDGGAGQISTVKKSLERIKFNIPLIALAKREELLYLINGRTLRLPQDSAGLLLLESLRDEAHRFGITYYRSRHRQQAIKSAWDELPGVGPVLKRKLKAVFGSINNLRQSKEADLSAVVGVKKSHLIKDFLG